MTEGGSIVFCSQFCNGNKMKNARLTRHRRRMIMNEKTIGGGISVSSGSSSRLLAKLGITIAFNQWIQLVKA
jgi:hypothetical protein